MNSMWGCEADNAFAVHVTYFGGGWVVLEGPDP